MYKDDIIVYASTATHDTSLLKAVEKFSRDINMKFFWRNLRDKNSVNNFQLEDVKINQYVKGRPMSIWVCYSLSALNTNM